MDPFIELHQITRINNETKKTQVLHVFYHYKNPEFPWMVPLFVHLVVLHRVAHGYRVAPIPEETVTRLTKLGVTLNLPQYEKIYHSLHVTSLDGIQLPASIPHFLSSSIQSPALIRDRVARVDSRLRQLVNQQKIATEPVRKLLPDQTESKETQMNSVNELERATHISVDIREPCGGNLGHGLSMVVIVANRVTDFDRRQVIRETYGGELKRNNKTEIYFLVAKSNDQT